MFVRVKRQVRHFGAVRNVILACCLHLPSLIVKICCVMCMRGMKIVRLSRQSNQRLDLLLRAFYVCIFMFIFDDFVLPVRMTLLGE